MLTMTKIDLITGILGAGKTTFLREYAQYHLRQGERIALLENDFGAVNVDMMMLHDLASDRCAVEMISGCGDPNCHRRRFRTQLIALGMQHFDRVIMEPSGIYDMDEFFDTLYEPPLDRWFEVGSILTIADAGMAEVLSEQMEYLLGSEAACCGRLLISKLSTVSEAPDAAAARVLAHINRALTGIQCDRRLQAGDVLAAEWSALTDADFASLSAAGYRRASYIKQFRAETIHSAVHYFMHIAVPEAEIPQMIADILQDPACGKIFRIKGSLPAEDGGWLKINATADKTEIAPVMKGQAVLIAIGDDIDRARIDEHLKARNTDPEYVSI